MFIKLTEVTSITGWENGMEKVSDEITPVYVNFDLINSFRAAGYTYLYATDCQFRVKETPEQILNMIKENKDV